MPSTVKIQLNEINLSKSRPIVAAAVKSLAASMAEVGLLNPIIVKAGTIFNGTVMTTGYRVIAGDHRVTAARELGWAEIDAFLHDGDELKAELIEIDENLQREEYTPAQRAKAISRRKEIWEAMHPEGGRKTPTLGGEQDIGFAADTERSTGESKRRTNENLARAKALGDDIDDVIGTSLDKVTELDALAKKPEAERKELIERAKAGENVSAKKKPEPAAFPEWMLARLEKFLIEFEKDAKCTVSKAVKKMQSLADPDDEEFVARLDDVTKSLLLLAEITLESASRKLS